MAEECHHSAVKAVLALPELLEHIIYLMPARTILTKASRVSRKWSQTINTSPRIRRLLFSLQRPHQQYLQEPSKDPRVLLEPIQLLSMERLWLLTPSSNNPLSGVNSRS